LEADPRRVKRLKILRPRTATSKPLNESAEKSDTGATGSS
jgi:hypothetical protein